METKTKQNNYPSMRYILFFVAAVLVLSIASLTYKFATLLSQSAFTTPSFTVLILDPKNAQVVHVDRQNQQIAIFEIENAAGDIGKLTNLGASLTFRVPIDARATYPEKQDILVEFFSFQNVMSSFFNLDRDKYKGLNAADILKMYIAARSIEKDRIFTVTRPKGYLADNNKRIDAELEDNFRDETIFGEKVSVEIINATEIGGFGARMAQVLENAGYNVIAVKNGESDSSYIINRGDPNSKTLYYLSRFLKLPIKTESTTPIADISVVFGKQAEK